MAKFLRYRKNDVSRNLAFMRTHRQIPFVVENFDESTILVLRNRVNPPSITNLIYDQVSGSM
ncbi:uncharacterized protein N7506_009395 [Penicillium brevicompactum]|uniref:uncharacterized protein n=1 Tax=Penicillium brevicompactum TaxID=5074 RepID=UPI0025424228|nr:uncharacterized protein N7506_009395 [Penicillium brevicompactum]KAJ5326293.1 hypothetical protein N7506_009395 [Penicillium brevicompactum]